MNLSYFRFNVHIGRATYSYFTSSLTVHLLHGDPNNILKIDSVLLLALLAMAAAKQKNIFPPALYVLPVAYYFHFS